jgi:hypothetical protein
MPRLAKLLVLWTGVLVLAGLLLAAGRPALAREGKAAGLATPAPEDEDTATEAPAPAYRDVLLIRCVSAEGRTVPPVEMMLSSPSGETAGYDPRYQMAYQEIPGASYKRAVVPGYQEAEAEVFTVHQAVSGDYNLEVIGVASGTYNLFLQGFNQKGSHVEVKFTHAWIKPGYIHHYRISYGNQGGPALEVKRTLITE